MNRYTTKSLRISLWQAIDGAMLALLRSRLRASEPLSPLAVKLAEILDSEFTRGLAVRGALGVRAENILRRRALADFAADQNSTKGVLQ